ncbi:hypothetical protein [Hyphomonas sp.]|jgi:uncharacterized repeat protein (TIGR01451 family)|uniref:hypothetical protein n=1 Tax=Hyphomonas sp. TaxID=87 RepID=UPI0032D98C9D
MTALGQASSLGKTVSNTASITYAHPTGVYEQTTDPAVFVVVARRTPSTIEFLRHAPNASDSIDIAIRGSDYSPSGSADADSFVEVGEAWTLSGAPLHAGVPMDFARADTYFTNEVILVRVTDAGQNGDSRVVETVMITISTDAGDEVVLRLYEDDPDSGVFYGYIPASADTTPMYDNTLTAPHQTSFTATYQDPFDQTEVSVDTALVDPFGRLFDSITGDLINNVEVTLVENASGLPADVFGIDGVSAYPSTLLTGTSVTDASGRIYDLAPGEFLFPLVAPAEYRLLVTPQSDYVFPSGLSKPDFTGLENSPFEIIGGSYGQTFEVMASGPLNFDVPLDTTTGLVLTKQTSQERAAVGDFIAYTIEAENRQEQALPVRIRDDLPAGFRFVSGSAQVSGKHIADPEIASNGRTLVFELGRLAAGETTSLSYVASIGPGTPDGSAVNSAIAINRFDRSISNRAEAVTNIQEDLLRSELTILGRVASDACRAQAPWPPQILGGTGVAGVRLYMETGEYVVSDENGLFHFEGVPKGTHVVQVDLETLPEGYEPIKCEENTRFAGSAVSQFVDATGGVIWRADFYLRRTELAMAEDQEESYSDVTEYLAFDQVWLDQQDHTIEWVYPDTDRTPSSRSVNIGVKLPYLSRAQLFLNGAKVQGANTQGRLASGDRSAQLQRWRGVDIVAGENIFELIVTGPDGREDRLQNAIWFVEQAQRAQLVPDQSLLVADGRTPPVIAVRVENSSGIAVHGGRLIEVDVAAPHRLESEDELTRMSPVTSGIVQAEGVRVGPDGIARITLAPTLTTGRVRVTIPLEGGRSQEIEAYLRPEARDWIVVGLGEGVLGFDDATSETDPNDKEGRLALFAKGLIRGDWLLTIALDTAKRHGDIDDELYESIDPNAYYTLYGDRSDRGHEAESRYPFYVKLEKDTVQLILGDFSTDLTDTQLGRYSRSLSGARIVGESDRISATGFVAETNQRFARDEIASDGTSGPYQLSAAPLVQNSDRLRIETRDRFRPDHILSVRSFERYADYEIDYATGELIFRSPLDAVDLNFNDQVIVVEYETYARAERTLSYGGRLAIRDATGRIEAGVSYVKEEAASATPAAGAELLVADLTLRITDRTEIRAELARSRRDEKGDDTNANPEADAYLLEIEHQGELISLTSYVREEEAGFGVGQTGTNTQALRRTGAKIGIKLSESINSATGGATTRSANAEAYREDALDTGDTRSVADVRLSQEGPSLSGSLGLRVVAESLADQDREAVLATSRLSKSFPEYGLNLSIAHEQPLAKNEVSLFPQRTIFGVDKSITERVQLNLRHEVTEGLNASGANSVVGLTVLPWTGGVVRADVNELTQDKASRLSATVGVDQTFQISDRWSASLGMTNRARIDGGEDARDLGADEAVSPLADGRRSLLTRNEGYTSAYAGVGYRETKTAASVRAEYRETAASLRKTLIIGTARELSDALSFAGGARLQAETGTKGARNSHDARLGLAWRPRDRGATLLNRFDFKKQSSEQTGESWKLVSNTAVNLKTSERTQFSVFHGLKYTKTTFNSQNYSGWTHLLGGEVRHDITPKIDIGLRGSVLAASATKTSAYAIGPSVGFSPRKNVWMSAGYNFTGFDDRDFEDAAYSRKGAFMKLRMKLDQSDLDGLLNWISPDAE